MSDPAVRWRRGEPPRRVRAEEHVGGRISGLTGLRTQHVSTNHVVTPAGDRPECVPAFLIHRLDPARPAESQTFDTAGHYVHGLARAGEGRRIDRIVQTVLWSRGNPDGHGALRGPTTAT